jgi:NAD+ diphosphatase
MLDATGFRFCPRCGAPSPEPHHENGMRCAGCDYIYFHNVAAAVGAIIEIDGGVLLTVRARNPQKGYHDLPGGFVAYNESLETAVIREVREELGIAVVVDHFFGSFPNRYLYHDVVYTTTDAFFICHPEPGQQIAADKDEVQQYAIVPADRLPFDHLAFPSNVAALTLYARHAMEERTQNSPS